MKRVEKRHQNQRRNCLLGCESVVEIYVILMFLQSWFRFEKEVTGKSQQETITEKVTKNQRRIFTKQTIYLSYNNFSLYQLCYGLKQHIPLKLNGNNIQTELECLFQDILKYLPALSEEEKSSIKTKLQQDPHTIRTKRSYNNLSKNPDI